MKHYLKQGVIFDMLKNIATERLAKQLAHNLKQKRLMRNLRIADMAKSTALSESTIKRIEKGDGGVSFDSWLRYMRRVSDVKKMLEMTSIYEDVIDLAINEENIRKRSSGKL